MDFSLSPHLQTRLAELRDFMRAEVYPLEPAFLTRPFGELLPALQEKRARVKALGWWAPPIPREFGGLGLPLAEFAHISEILGASPLGHFIFNCQAPDMGNMEVLLAYGTPGQKETYLRPVASGAVRSCFSMTEPGRAGSNPVWLGTTASKDGDDYIINGRKWYTSAADGAAFAVVMAVTNPEAAPHARASMILVPTGTPGFTIHRNLSVMGHVGQGWTSHAEVIYDNVRVPQLNRLGPEGSGFAIAQARLGPGRIHHCMRWVGICERALELMCARVVARELAPGDPLAGRQLIQAAIADSRAEINAARLMVLQAAWKIDQVGAQAASIEISTIKFFVAGVLQRVLDRALQAHGGLGMTDDTPIAFWYRFERAARIYDGADEVHKLAVARRVLREYGFTPKRTG